MTDVSGAPDSRSGAAPDGDPARPAPAPAPSRPRDFVLDAIPVLTVAAAIFALAWIPPESLAVRSLLRLVVAALVGVLVYRLASLLRERRRTATRLEAANAELERAAEENRRLAADLEARVAELERLQATVEASARTAAIGQIVAAVAHEVNNPLTGVLGFADLLIAEHEPGDPERADLETIRTEALRARGIIRSLVDYAQLEASRRRPADVDALVRESVDGVLSQFAARRIELVATYGAAVELPLDGLGIVQAVDNVLANAVQHQPDGGSVRVTTAVDGDEVAITVADAGPGMSEEVAARAFELFFSTREQDRGYGLGLPMSRRIVESHGGTMSLSSVPGRGTTVVLRLPIAPEVTDGDA